MSKFFKKFWICFLPLFIFAAEEETHNIEFGDYPTPWFTGPLIAPTAYTVSPGHFALQTYLGAFVDIGRYNSDWKIESIPNIYNVQLRLRCKVGVTKWMDMTLIPQAIYKETEGEHSTGFGDIIYACSFQLMTFKLTDPWPSIKLSLATTIPSGKYQELNPKLKRTDVRGEGSWYPEIALAFSKLWYLSGVRYFEGRFFLGYRIGTPTSIKGVSAYGGDLSTRGTAYPGNIFYADIAFEYNFTKSWAIACDLNYLHRNRSRFSGKTQRPAVHPSTEQFSLAPAIQYNWSENIGAIGGVWFSLWGRNSPQFVNGVLSLLAYF